MEIKAGKLSKKDVFRRAKEHYGADDALAQKIYDRLANGFLADMDIEKRVHYVFLQTKYTSEELGRMTDDYVESLGGWELTPSQEKRLAQVHKELARKADKAKTKK